MDGGEPDGAQHTDELLIADVGELSRETRRNDCRHASAGFDESFDACEDVELNYRIYVAGLKSYLSPKLKVFYYPRSTLSGLWRQMVRYGLGRFRFSRKHGNWSIMQWLPAAGFVGFAVLLLMAIFSAPIMKVFQMALAFYLLLVIFYSLALATKHKNLNCFLFGPLIFPTIHFGLGYGFLKGVVEVFAPEEKESGGHVYTD